MLFLLWSDEPQWAHLFWNSLTFEFLVLFNGQSLCVVLKWFELPHLHFLFGFPVGDTLVIVIGDVEFGFNGRALFIVGVFITVFELLIEIVLVGDNRVIVIDDVEREFNGGTLFIVGVFITVFELLIEIVLVGDNRELK